MCVQKVTHFQRIFLDMTPSSAKSLLKSALKQSTVVLSEDTNDTTETEGFSTHAEDRYKSLCEQLKKELEDVRASKKKLKSEHEENLINQTRSNQDILDDCHERLRYERRRKEDLKRELRKHMKEHEQQVQRLEKLAKEEEREKQKWRAAALEKTRTIANLTEELQKKQERIVQLENHPLLGSSSVSEFIVKLNQKRDVSSIL